MNIEHLFELANHSGGTLYLMIVLLLVALTVIVERTRFLSNMQSGGEELITMLKQEEGKINSLVLTDKQSHLPHARLFEILHSESGDADRTSLDDHLEEAIMHEVPTLDQSLWMLDTVITLAPLLGLFGTIIGMFNAFHALGDVMNDTTQVTGGIAEALIATASGLFIAMIGLVFFNALFTRVRIILHQLETIKIMMLNRYQNIAVQPLSGKSAVEVIRAQARG
ncbi:MAG: MotA/TolQ/ExbB proton channel family protein [Gallionella sp.]